MKNWGILLILVIVISLNFVASANSITGYVEDALDSETANDKIVFLWNPANGESDNLTDTIGINGASGISNKYLFDCDNLATPCVTNDILRIKVINSGDNYVSNYTSITVTSSSPDNVSNITLNSPPTTTIISPINNLITNNENNNFNCSFDDLDTNDGFLSLYGNFSGSWGHVETKATTNGYVVFSKSATETTYNYACLANDELVQAFGNNNTITIDTTLPTINFITTNITSTCGGTPVLISCETLDTNGIKNVTINTKSNLLNSNNTATLATGDIYESTQNINEKSSVNFTCYSEDNAGNIAQIQANITAHSGLADLTLNATDITFSKVNPLENEEINISANITNLGCVDADNFLVSFHDGTNQIGNNKTISISSFTNFLLKIPFISTVGLKNILVNLDISFIISEDNETNNQNSNSFNVPSWQEFYGNITKTKVLRSGIENFGNWGNESKVTGHVFMTDSESNIDWLNLIAIGKNITGGIASNDWNEIDTLLDMQNFSDSITTEYSSATTQNLTIHKKNITDVSTIPSTDNDNFTTGILWDATDDSNGEFDSIEKEDIVFVAKINTDTNGKYGNYDYEIKVPVRLREYDGANTQDIYFYYELI